MILWASSSVHLLVHLLAQSRELNIMHERSFAVLFQEHIEVLPLIVRVGLVHSDAFLIRMSHLDLMKAQYDWRVVLHHATTAALTRPELDGLHPFRSLFGHSDSEGTHHPDSRLSYVGNQSFGAGYKQVVRRKSPNQNLGRFESHAILRPAGVVPGPMETVAGT